MVPSSRSRIPDAVAGVRIDRGPLVRWTLGMDFEQLWADLAPVGRSAGGGYFRQPWTGAEGELRQWFTEQAAQRGLQLEGDGIGNLVAWWGSGDDAGLSGSHLASVFNGGAYAGPLGVVSAFLAVDVLRSVASRRRAPSGSGRSSRRRAPASGWPASARGSPPGRSAGTAPASCATVTAWPWPTRSSAPACPDPTATSPTTGGCGSGSAASSSCTWSRAATSSTATPPSVWRARSGHTAATGSTSPGRPTTPAPPGWRTATTRCSATR